MIFTFLSSMVDTNSTSRNAAQIVSGIGFLGAGVILKGELEGRTESEIRDKPNKVLNLTTAASVWFSGAIGMAIGFNYHFIALVLIGYFILVSRLPSLKRAENRTHDDWWEMLTIRLKNRRLNINTKSITSGSTSF